MNLSDLKGGKLIVENLTNSIISIGDLNIHLSPKGKKGYIQNLLTFDSITKRTRKSTEEIANSKHLEELIVLGKVQLWNKDGKIDTLRDQITEAGYLTKALVMESLEGTVKTINDSIGSTVASINESIQGAISSIEIPIEEKIIGNFYVSPNQSTSNGQTTKLAIASDEDNDKFEIEDNTKIKFLHSGTYNVSYVLPCENNINGIRASWINKNRTAPPYTSLKTFMSLKANSDKGATTATYWLERYQGPTIAHMNSTVNGWTVEFFYKPISFGTATASAWDGTIAYVAGSSENDSVTAGAVTSMFAFMQFSDGRIGYGGTGNLTNRWAPILQLNQWYHLAITCSGTSTKTLKLYINGELAGSNANPSVFELTRASINNQYYVGFGVRIGNGLHKFQLQDFRISTNVRYISNFTVSSDRLVADASTYCLYSLNDKIGNCPRVIRTSSTSNAISEGEKTFEINTVLPGYIVVNDYVTCLSPSSSRPLYGKITSISGTTIVINAKVRRYTDTAKTDWTLVFHPQIKDYGANSWDLSFLSGKEGTFQNMVDNIPDFEFAQGYIPSSYQNAGSKYAEAIVVPIQDEGTVLQGMEIITVSPNDYIELEAYQNSGSALAMEVPLKNSKISIVSM